jgi:cellulose synthase/poly-beta-1,6-N-acetylglucosamine synthase-like glycosyltransferase
LIVIVHPIEPMQPTSLVSTVLNDREGTQSFFEYIESQTVRPQEIIVVDGGSTDGTWELLQTYAKEGAIPLIAHQEIGCNVARGRNLAITLAQYELIVSTDIGCLWEPQWLEELVQPLKTNPKIEAVMGSWQVRWEDLQGDWAKVEYALLNAPKLIASPTSHASSRAIAYRKALWQKIGGYPEDLTLAGDDMVFALMLHQATDQVACAPTPRCHWERPSSLKAFCKESRRNFRGAGEAGIWMDYGLLTSLRLGIEALSIPIAFFGLLGILPLGVGLGVGSLALTSLGQRILRLRPASHRLATYGQKRSWLKLLYFEYLTKFWANIGYWDGFLAGVKQCQDCRTRLRHWNAV